MRGCRYRAVIAVGIAFVLAACSGSGPKLRSLSDARRPVGELDAGVARLTALAHTMGSAGTPEVPPGEAERLRRIGALSSELIRTLKPLDAAIVVEGIQAAATDLARVITASPDARIVVSRPSRYNLRAEILLSPPADRRDLLSSAFDVELQRLSYVSLLADPTAREKFAPRRSVSDFPASIPVGEDGQPDPDLIGIQTTADWRRMVFDDRGRLVVPEPLDDDIAWIAFLGWAKWVVPDLGRAGSGLFEEIQAGRKQHDERHP